MEITSTTEYCEVFTFLSDESEKGNQIVNLVGKF